jgi:hypothetical protein
VIICLPFITRAALYRVARRTKDDNGTDPSPEIREFAKQHPAEYRTDWHAEKIHWLNNTSGR